MHVFEVRASSSPPRLPLCQILFLLQPPLLSSPWRKTVYSITRLIWCPRNQSLCFEKNSQSTRIYKKQLTRSLDNCFIHLDDLNNFKHVSSSTQLINMTTYVACSYKNQVSNKRIRVPLTPEILKSSNNRTVLSLKGSVTSESRTYNVFSFNQSQQNIHILGRRHTCRRTNILPRILFSFFIFSSSNLQACWMELSKNRPHGQK